jgi:hypothetical protein
MYFFLQINCTLNAFTVGWRKGNQLSVAHHWLKNNSQLCIVHYSSCSWNVDIAPYVCLCIHTCTTRNWGFIIDWSCWWNETAATNGPVSHPLGDIWAWRTIVKWCWRVKENSWFVHQSAVWQSYMQSYLVANQEVLGEGNDVLCLWNISFILVEIFNMP